MECDVHGGRETVQVNDCQPEPRLFNLDSPQHEILVQWDGVDQFIGGSQSSFQSGMKKNLS